MVTTTTLTHSKSWPVTEAYVALPGVAPVPERARWPRDTSELAALVDAAIHPQLQFGAVPGAAVAIVKDGELVFRRGYGVADLDTRRPVDPDTTLFRLGSVSKLLTATAAMQLVEQGQLALDADLNGYLGDIQINADQPGAVTLRHLLTHTAGFDIRVIGRGSVATDPKDLLSLEQALTANLPPRVRPALAHFSTGSVAAYSNWGMVLAGYLVQRTAGLSFDAAIEEQIFSPLGMRHSSFREPLPVALGPLLATGHTLLPPEPEAEAPPTAVPQPFGYYHAMAPAASLSSTVTDMARFMSAHLQAPPEGAKLLLSAESLRQMHGRVLSPHPHLNGAGLGFMEEYLNGRRLLVHSGATPHFISEMFLLPDERLGVIVMYNAFDVGLLGSLKYELLDAYYPAALPEIAVAEDAPDRVAIYAGAYASMRRSLLNWEKILTPMLAFEITGTPRGTLILGEAYEGAPEWIEVAAQPGLFRKENTDSMMAFVQAADGKTYRLGVDPFNPDVRLPLIETPAVHQQLQNLFRYLFWAVLGLAIVICLSSAGRVSAIPWLAICAGLIPATNLSILAALQKTLMVPPDEMMQALPDSLLALMGLSLLSLAICGVFALLALRSWPRTGWVARGTTGALCLLFAGFLAWLQYWRLLGFQLA